MPLLTSLAPHTPHKIKPNHELALELWKTKNIDARLLSILLLKPKALPPDDLERMLQSVAFVRVTDWFDAYVVKKHPNKEQLRRRWIDADHPMVARVGWSLTTERVAKSPEGLEITALLDRIESQMASAAPEVQWTMNSCLAEIGIQRADHRERALAIGEALGVYRDYPVSRGCTSPFAPIWINEMVSRQA